MLRIAVVDDHELLRVGVSRAVAAVEGWEVIASVSSFDELSVNGFEDLDLVILDYVTPGAVTGLAAVDVLRKQEIDVVILTALDTEDLDRQAKARGAIGAVSKGAGPDRLREVIRSAINLPAPPGLRLTQREREVLDCLRRGHRNQEIAKELSISLSAVKRHLERIMEKTDVRTRNGLAGLPIDVC